MLAKNLPALNFCNYFIFQASRNFLEVCQNRQVKIKMFFFSFMEMNKQCILELEMLSFFPGERKSPWVACCCVIMAFSILFLQQQSQENYQWEQCGNKDNKAWTLRLYKHNETFSGCHFDNVKKLRLVITHHSHRKRKCVCVRGNRGSVSRSLHGFPGLSLCLLMWTICSRCTCVGSQCFLLSAIYLEGRKSHFGLICGINGYIVCQNISKLFFCLFVFLSLTHFYQHISVERTFINVQICCAIQGGFVS